MVFATSFINGLVMGSIFALFAASFTIIFGVMDIPNMAHAVLFAGGAYVYFQLVELMGFPWFVGIAVGILVIAVIGGAIERGLFQPLYKRGETEYIFGILLVTLGLHEIFERSFGDIWGHEPHYLGLSELQNYSVPFAGVSMNYLEIIVLAVAIVSFVFLYWLVNYTMIGLSLRAIVQDRGLAQMKGINVGRVFFLAFMLGSGMAALAGVLNASMFSLTPAMGFDLLIKAFIIVILGGIGRIFGAALAGYALGMYEAFAVLYLSSYYIFASEFAVLILFFLLKGHLMRGGENSLIVAAKRWVALRMDRMGVRG